MVSKKKRSSPKLRVIFRPKSEIQRFFPPKIRWSPKKKKKKEKKVFTAIETDFSAEIVRFRLVGGMHPEMETDFSKWRLIFRPKSLVLSWWGVCIPPPKSATDCCPTRQHSDLIAPLKSFTTPKKLFYLDSLKCLYCNSSSQLG